MIQANELRLGNVVAYNHHMDRMGTISWIQEHSIEIEYFERCEEDLSNGAIVSPQFLIPIPLTPEILEKCGFVNGYKQLTNKLRLEWSFGEEFWIDRENETLFTFEKITSLHQLQNLYFVLTGEELNYTP